MNTNKNRLKTHLTKRGFLRLAGISGLAATLHVMTTGAAYAGPDKAVGNPLDDFIGIAEELTLVSPLAGLGVFIFSILKFKIHHDNPLGPGHRWEERVLALWWSWLDEGTRDRLTAAGYSTEFLAAAIADFGDGNPTALSAFVEAFEAQEQTVARGSSPPPVGAPLRQPNDCRRDIGAVSDTALRTIKTEHDIEVAP